MMLRTVQLALVAVLLLPCFSYADYRSGGGSCSKSGTSQCGKGASQCGKGASQCNSCGCVSGTPGIPGNHGIPGNPGNQGPAGPKGMDGRPGSEGVPGSVGEQGVQGPPGPSGLSNWKQCAKRNLNSDLDNGKIYDCKFSKKKSNSHLRVVYQGNMRVYTAGKCKRWFFTFNTIECSIPIDTVVYTGTRLNIIRTATIEGYCSGIPEGDVSVEFNVGDCSAGYTGGDAYTGWASVSRIIVEEVGPPQE